MQEYVMALLNGWEEHSVDTSTNADAPNMAPNEYEKRCKFWGGPTLI